MDLIGSLGNHLRAEGREDRLEGLKGRFRAQMEALKTRESEQLAKGAGPLRPGPAGTTHGWAAGPKEMFPVIPAFLPIHAHSVIAFLRGRPGHAFTGIVVVRAVKQVYTDPGQKGPSKAKIFLFPLNADDPSASGNTKPRGARPVAKQTTARVFGTEFDPITHGGSGNPSHGQLVEMIRKKAVYKQLSQDQGDFIGFTVHKGMPPRLPNRYVFTSASSNGKAFPMVMFEAVRLPTVGTKWMPRHTGPLPKANDYVTEPWARAIITAVGAIGSLQEELDNAGLDPVQMPDEELLKLVKEWNAKRAS